MNKTNTYVFVSFFCILAMCVPIFVCWCYCTLNAKKSLPHSDSTPLLLKITAPHYLGMSKLVPLTKN